MGTNSVENQYGEKPITILISNDGNSSTLPAVPERERANVLRGSPHYLRGDQPQRESPWLSAMNRQHCLGALKTKPW